MKNDFPDEHKLSDTLREMLSVFETGTSKPRFLPYRKGHSAAIDAMAAYMWSTALSEALYPSLQCLEVVLRNAVHDALSAYKSNKLWYDDPYLLLANEQKRVEEAKSSLTQKRKQHDPPRVIAELTFGMWCALFSSPYERTVVVPIIKNVFPNAPKHLRSAEEVSRRLQCARDVRNRVFHHERVWHMPELDVRYSEIIEMIGWINPTHHELLAIIDRFNDVRANRWQSIQEKIDFSVSLKEESRSGNGAWSPPSSVSSGE